jgi:hypothetical protein
LRLTLLGGLKQLPPKPFRIISSQKLRVSGAPIEFQRVVVHYGNGTREELEFRDRIRAGGQTRAIDLRGGDRAITSVDFHFSKANWRSARPKVSLYGR